MKIQNFKNLIQELPYKKHSIDVKKENWEKFNASKEIIDKIFEQNDKITISREDLYKEAKEQNLSVFILKTLMWGYPTGGRGNHIKTLLECNNFLN